MRLRLPKLKKREPARAVPMEVRAKHPLAIRWFHWINFPVLTLMIWSGLMILWANSVFTLAGRPILSQEFLSHPLAWYDTLLGHLGRKPGDEPYTLAFRLAEGMWWHFAVAWLFAINGTLYFAYLLRSGEWRTLFPDRHSLKESIHVVLHDLRLSKRPLPPRKYNGAQRIAYTGVLVLGFGSLVTGIAIYKPMQLSPLTQMLGGYTAARFEHFWIMILFLGFFVVHIGQVVKTGWNNFRGMITGHELAPIEAPLPEAEVVA